MSILKESYEEEMKAKNNFIGSRANRPFHILAQCYH